MDRHLVLAVGSAWLADLPSAWLADLPLACWLAALQLLLHLKIPGCGYRLLNFLKLPHGLLRQLFYLVSVEHGMPSLPIHNIYVILLYIYDIA